MQGVWRVAVIWVSCCGAKLSDHMGSNKIQINLTNMGPLDDRQGWSGARRAYIGKYGETQANGGDR